MNLRPLLLSRLGNTARVAVARVLTVGLYYPWRVCEKLSGQSLGCVAHCHHLLRDIFRKLGPSWPVCVAFPNPVSRGRSLRMRLDLCEITQLAYFRGAGRYEEQWLRVIADAIKHAGCFVDVGAHFGHYAMAVAQAFPDKRVIAVEPAPENVSALRAHLAMNGLHSVEVHGCAIASSGERMRYYRNPLNDGGGGLEPVQEYQSGERRVAVAAYLDAHPEFAPSVEVPTCRIDSLVHESCVIKIDVEGSELDALRSAERLLAMRRVPVMVVEVWRGHLDAVIEYLGRFEIDCFRAGQERPIGPGEGMERRIANILCVRRDVSDSGSWARRLV